MLQVKDVQSAREQRLGMDEPSDDALLAAIGQRSDREAFAALFARHQKPAYNLALYLTGKRELAEEAVQDGLLDIWLTASSYKPGNARGWIMRIVANKSAHLFQKWRRNRKTMRENSGQAAEREDLPPAEEVEHAETLIALRRMLERLPMGDRHLVALYYGAGLSHEEISAELSMPRPTVTFRLKKAVEALRSHLVEAGFAAGAPLLDVQRMHEAISTGHESPPHLTQTVLRHVERHVEEAVSSISRGKALAPASSQAPVWLAVGFVVAAAGGLGWFLKPSSTTPASMIQDSNAEEVVPALASEPPLAAPPSALKAEDWQPVPLNDLQEFISTERAIGPAEIQAIGPEKYKKKPPLSWHFYDYKSTNDQRWKIQGQLQGAQLEYFPQKLEVHVLHLGPWLKGAYEWFGRVEYPDSHSEGNLFFLLIGSEDSTTFGSHRPEGTPCNLRLLAWPIAEGVRILSVRDSGQKKLGIGTERIRAANGKYMPGFGATARVAIRELRFRKLPDGWKPADDAQLKPLIDSGKIRMP